MELRRPVSELKLPVHSSLTIVIKVGTSSVLRAEVGSFNLTNLASICETVRDLHHAGHRVVVVSSGSQGVGCKRLGLPAKPTALAQKQACAAVGQVHLMRFYDDFFSALGVPCAQVLLTQDNLGIRSQYLNARNTFEELFNYGTVPVVNENDTVAVEQLRIGDNDTLSAQVATLVQADWLFLLTDVAALYTANPSTDPSATPIHEVADIAALQVDTSTSGTQWGTGGMSTKLTAGRIATAAGCHMGICLASEPQRIREMLRGERSCGTVFLPLPHAARGRRRWILSVPVNGAVWMDSGAITAIAQRRKSLFAAGIVKVVGAFSVHDAISVCDAGGHEIGRALANYSHVDVAKVKGLSSREFEEALGYLGSPEIAHRDNICLLTRPVSRVSSSAEMAPTAANLAAALAERRDSAAAVFARRRPPVARAACLIGCQP